MSYSTDKSISRDYPPVSHSLTIPDTLTIKIKPRFLESDLVCTIARLPFEFTITISKELDKSLSSIINKITQTLEKEFEAVMLSRRPDTWLFWKYDLSNIVNNCIIRDHGDFSPVRIEELSNEWPYIPLLFRENAKKRKWWCGYACGGVTVEAVISFTIDPPPLHTLMHWIWKKEGSESFENERKWTAYEMSNYDFYRRVQIERMKHCVPVDSKLVTVNGRMALRRPKHILCEENEKKIVAVYQEDSDAHEVGLTFLQRKEKWEKYFVHKASQRAMKEKH